MFKREEAAADDDFVTKTNKSRKKTSKTNANGDDAAGGGDAGGSGNGSSSVKEAGAGASASGGSEGISLRPRTMFTVKGRGQTEADGSPAYRPQWSKDGDGFVSNTPSAGKDADSDANRRKGKVVRYSKEELLALHVDTQAPPKFLVETAVASEISLPPVGKLPFDYEEIYKQWALNRNRGRGRGRTTTGGQNNNEGNTNERSRSNGKWDEQPKWDKPKRGEEEENSWERGTSSRNNDRRGDIWDDVGMVGGDSGDFDLSSMSAAAEKFRLEMDAMRDQELEKLREAAVVDMETFDEKLESAAATGQFEDSDEEVAWDMPLEAELARPIEDSPLAFQASQFDQKLLQTAQPSLSLEEPSFSLSSLSDATFGMGALAVEVADEWFYLDPQGLQQGPFKTAEMREWFEAGYFKPNLPIRFGREGGNFTPLANHFVQGQLPFATIPRPSPKVNLEHEMRIREQQRLMELHQQQQQQQQMMQLQQQQEQQRMLQFNQEEKIRLEMQRLELARQQQNQMFQQQQQLIQQQQQQQMLHQQQQSSWQRSQREGIMSALGIFGGDSGLGVNDHFHQEPPAPFQSDFRAAHQFDVNPPSRIQEPAFSHNAQRIDDPWGGVGGARAYNEPVAQQGFFGGDVQAQQMRLQEPSMPEPPKPRGEEMVDPWRKPPAEVSSEASASRQREEPAPAPLPQQPIKQEQPSPAKEKSKTSPVKKQSRPTEAPKQQAPSAWASSAPSKPSSSKNLKDIQADEQRELRKSLEQDDSSLAQMGAQLKMMLGVNALAGAAPQPAAQRPAPPQPTAAPTPTPTPAAAPAAPSAPAPSPWGRTAVVAPTLKASKSMREILEEEERLAAERAKRIENTPTSSHWSNVVAGTAPTPPVVPKVSRLGPVPASVLKSTTRSRTSVTGESISVPAKVAVTTPSKAESDASFWNFGAAGAAKTGSTPSSASPSASFGSGSAPSDFMSWCAKQVKAINGSDDLTLVEYCAGLEDPVEIRENLSAYLGSTPRVSAFATEFIQRKKSMPSSKKSADASFTGDDANGKKGKRRTKGQKVDPSLLNYSVGS